MALVAPCMCADGVLVRVDLALLDSTLLKSVTEAAPGDVIPLPGIASGCLRALMTMMHPSGNLFAAHENENETETDNIDNIDIIRAAIELDCTLSVHMNNVRRHVAESWRPLEGMNPHHQMQDETKRWFDVFAAMPPLYFAYMLDGRIRDRLRNLLSRCRSPSGAAVESAIDFFRRMGRRPYSSDAKEMTSLARALAGSDVVRGREVEVAKCLFEHVVVYDAVVDAVVSSIRNARLNFWEVLCEACIDSERPGDAMAIADVYEGYDFHSLVWKLIPRDLLGTLPTTASREFLGYLYASGKGDAIWPAALTRPSRKVVEWAMELTGKQVTPKDVKAAHYDARMLFDIAIRDERCTDAQIMDLLLACKTHISVDLFDMERIEQLLRVHGAFTSALLVILATKTKPSTGIAAVIEHIASSPGLPRESGGWFEAIAYFARRRDLAAIDRLIGKM